MTLKVSLFNSFLDKNQYITRKQKLDIYKNIGILVCNSNSYTSIVYDSKTKKSQRKIILSYETYKTLKMLYDVEIKEV